MADKKQPSRRSAPGARAPEKQVSSHRNDVIRCENCGEYYSTTYKRCPFCDERPGRTGVNGRRVDGRAPIHPVQIIALVVSLVLIIAAAFIVFKKVGPLLFGDKNPGSSISSSQSGNQSGVSSDTSEPGSSSSGDVSQPEIPVVPVNSISFERNDFTLLPNEEFSLAAKVDPADAVITWTSSDPNALTVDENGVVKNVNRGPDKVKVTVTATAGDKSAACTFYCKPGSTGVPSTGDNNPGGTTTTTPDTPVTPNSKGTVVNAGNGLNIRSGAGSSYDKVASAPNGAEVTILGEENGWYKIDYGAGKIGYASKDYISVG